MEDLLKWFKIQCIYPVSSGLSTDLDEDQEDVELKRIRFKANDIDQFETGYAFLSLSEDPITNITPGCLLPKDGKNKKNFTLITLSSGNLIYALGKPEDVYDKLNEHQELISVIEQAPKD